MKPLLYDCITPLLLIFVATISTVRAANPRLWEQVSGEKALAHVAHLVDLGPRPAGSASLERSRTYIEEQLKSFGWQTTRQEFTDATPRGKTRFVNLIARFEAGKSSPGFLLCSHYDTKLFDDIRFVGANDGGSSAGLLLEIARVLQGDPKLAAKIELVFFDGEEAYEQFSATDGLYGSRYFARMLAESKDATRFRAGILLDMVGDRSLNITLSPDSPATLARDIFASADALKQRSHFTYFQGEILDDHSPLNKIGIPTIDLIDFDYPPWHTAEDTMDKLSPESLQIVGSVVAYYLSEFAFK